ncbi:hypothetical protein AB5I41_24245 [Sphingomonas sp. MMS24-JH45]
MIPTTAGRLTAAVQQKFLDTLAATSNVRASARAVGVHAGKLYAARSCGLRRGVGAGFGGRLRPGTGDAGLCGVALRGGRDRSRRCRPGGRRAIGSDAGVGTRGEPDRSGDRDGAAEPRPANGRPLRAQADCVGEGKRGGGAPRSWTCSRASWWTSDGGGARVPCPEARGSRGLARDAAHGGCTPNGCSAGASMRMRGNSRRPETGGCG